MKLFNCLTVSFLFALLASCGSNVGFQPEGENPGVGDSNLDETAVVATYLQNVLLPDPKSAEVDETDGGVCPVGYELIDRTQDKEVDIVEKNIKILEAVATLKTLNLDPKIEAVLDKIVEEKTKRVVEAQAILYISPDALLQKKVASKVMEYYNAEMKAQVPLDEHQKSLALLGSLEQDAKVIGDIQDPRIKTGKRISVVKQYCVPAEITGAFPLEAFSSSIRINKADGLINDRILGSDFAGEKNDRILDSDFAGEKMVTP